MNERHDNFEQRLIRDLERLGHQAPAAPTPREVTIARHRRMGKRLAAVGSAAAMLLAVALAGLWFGGLESRPAPVEDSTAVAPLVVEMDRRSRRTRVREALESLGVEGRIRVEKSPSGEVSFVTTSTGRATGELERGLVRLLRNFDAAWIEVRNGEMEIALAAGGRGASPRRRGAEGESR
jgi:hypothetical protein